MQLHLVVDAGKWEELRAYLLADWTEHLAFILVGHGIAEGKHLLLAKELIKIPDEALHAPEHTYGLALRLDVLLNVINRANRQGSALVEAHSHPIATGHVEFSALDLEGQRELANYLADTLPGRPYGALVLGQDAVDGKVWIPGLGGHLKTGHRWTGQNRPKE